MRGYMAILIMLLHLTRTTVVIQLHFWHAVDVFFVLSGYVLCHVYGRDLPFSWNRFRRYMVHRIARIVPVAWLCVIVFFSLYSAIKWAGLKPNHLLDTSFANFVGNMLFLDANIPGFSSVAAKWSVSNEMVVYILLFPFIYMLARQKTFLIVVWIAIAVAQVVFWERLSEVGSLFSRCIPEFTAGAIIYYYSDRIQRRSWAYALLLVCLTGMFFAGDRFQVIFATGIVLAVLSLENRDGGLFSNPTALYFGNISYSLYLWHGICVLLAAGLIQWRPVVYQLYPLMSIVPISGAILIAHYSYHYIEMPCKAAIIKTIGQRIQM